MADEGIDVIVKFARVVSDAGAPSDVLHRLADALYEHVCPNGVAVCALGPDAKLRLAAERGLGERCAEVVADFDEVSALGDRLLAACAAGAGHRSQVTWPLVAGGDLFGAVVMVCKRDDELDATALALADGLVDLAAIALGTATHVAKLERQFAELRKQQEMLAQSEKLRAIGQMAAGVSHDLKNILNPLSLHIQVITRALDRGRIDDAKESAAEMKDVVQRGLQTLERLRSFSRQSNDAKPEVVDLDRLAREAAAIGKSRAASGGGRLPRIVEELGAPARVVAISGEIVSALVNLVVNAIDAMASLERGGTITLRSGEDEHGSWVEVADDGPGMPPEVASRVFEPFFTTKGQDGTGLGLAMVYATMERHGGSVTVDTAAGKGTTFRLSFPRSDGPSSVAAIASRARRRPDDL